MTAPEWRDCADPDELAAAVAAGIEVQRNIVDDVWHRIGHHRHHEFVYGMAHCTRYRLPTSWTWSPEPPAPDDLRERIARAAAGGYMRVPTDALDGMYLGPPWLDVADAVLAVLPTPPPTPPWPGAVLSGVCDEDGAPTWLAQAGQVRGEQVRGWCGDVWNLADVWDHRAWVEVRAPRAVPEPETERVPWWEALGRTTPDGERIVAISQDEAGDPIGDTGNGGSVELAWLDDGTPAFEVLR